MSFGKVLKWYRSYSRAHTNQLVYNRLQLREYVSKSRLIWSIFILYRLLSKKVFSLAIHDSFHILKLFCQWWAWLWKYWTVILPISALQPTNSSTPCCATSALKSSLYQLGRSLNRGQESRHFLQRKNNLKRGNSRWTGLVTFYESPRQSYTTTPRIKLPENGATDQLTLPYNRNASKFSRQSPDQTSRFIIHVSCFFSSKKIWSQLNEISRNMVTRGTVGRLPPKQDKSGMKFGNKIFVIRRATQFVWKTKRH